MADEKVNMGPEENKPPETLSPPGQGNLPPLEENNAPAVSGEDKAAPDHVEPDPPLLLLFLVKIKRPPIMWSPIRRQPTSTHSRLFFPAWAKIHPPRPAR